MGLMKRRMAGCILGCAFWTIAGCSVPLPDILTDGNVGKDPAAYPNQRIQGEPNDSFDDPLSIILESDGSGHLRGWISSIHDVDIYTLEGLEPGDRLILDVSTHGNGMDASLAVFDEAGRLAFENDDRNLDAGLTDPFLNQVIRRSSSVYFVAIAQSPLATVSRIGSYEVLINVARGGEVPPTAGQVVLLDFDGGTITIPPDEYYSVSAFDASRISPIYWGQTATIRDAIADTIRENYTGLDLDVRVVPGDSLPAAGTYSSILMGGYDPEVYGISQAIDSFNTDHTDSAIIFVEAFKPTNFGRLLTTQELGAAIGNVASHELGHLLGLNHVADPRDIMDTTGSSVSLLDDQQFRDSPLDTTIFPVGTQDSLLLLIETLGVIPSP